MKEAMLGDIRNLIHEYKKERKNGGGHSSIGSNSTFVRF
jgi:hypothetical protein